MNSREVNLPQSSQESSIHRGEEREETFMGKMCKFANQSYEKDPKEVQKW